jgi:hypothetical protein
LADGNTLLHKLYNNKVALEYVYNLVNQDSVNDDGEAFHIPLLKNRNNKTALDFAMGKSGEEKKQSKKIDTDAWEKNSNEEGGQAIKGKLDEAIYRKPAELIIKNIGLYPFGLFKVETKHLIDTMIKKNLFEFLQFMNNMAKTPSFLQGYDRARVEVEETCGACVFDTSNVWPSNIKEYNFEKPEG